MNNPVDNFKIVKARESWDGYVLLCHIPESVTPWVTWHSPTIDGSQSRYWGHYHFDVESAQQDFDTRS